MTSTKMQGKILDYTTNTSNKEVICKLKTKLLDRRTVINKSDFLYTPPSERKPETLKETKGLNIKELENAFFEYIDSCNDDNFLEALVNILNTRIKKLKINYEYNGVEFEKMFYEECVNHEYDDPYVDYIGVTRPGWKEY